MVLWPYGLTVRYLMVPLVCFSVGLASSSYNDSFKSVSNKRSLMFDHILLGKKLVLRGTIWGWVWPSSALIRTKTEWCGNLALQWKFKIAIKIHHCDENSSLWWKFIVVIKMPHCDKTLSLRWKFTIMIEIYHCDENSSSWLKFVIMIDIHIFW